MMRHLLTIIGFLFFTSSVFAQTNTITGRVTKDDGTPLQSMTITEKGTDNRTQTDSQGSFTLNLRSLPSAIVTTGIGYKRTETPIQNLNPVTISMQEDGAVVDEVIVVGYQKQSQKKTTSAVQVISGKEIENMAAPSFESLLQGRVSGVNIQNFTGEPGARNTFTIRGNSTISPDLNAEIDLANTMSTPLYIIDGMPMSVTDLASSSATGTNYIAGININDIESIVVQKDASATAVWGSRGANGVVTITTKAGKSGKPQIRVSYYKGLTQRPELQNTLLGATERRTKLDILQQYAYHNQWATLPQALTDSLNNSYNNATDWQDLFYQAGNIDNMDGSIAGGTDIVNYRLSLGYYNEDGIVRQTGFKRYSLRGNFSFNLAKFLKSDFTFSASRMDRKRGLGKGINNVVPINAGSMPSSFVGLSDLDYEFYMGQYDKIMDDNQTDILNMFSKTYVDILPGLQYSLEASVQANFDTRDQFQPREITRGWNFAQSNKNNAYIYNIANVLNYNKKFNDAHGITVTAMQSFQYDDYRSTYLYGENLPTDDIHVVQGVNQKNLYGNSNIRKSGLVSYLGQFSYDYKEKYIFNASFRTDASSRFGKNTKWGNFPSLSLAWVASDENFLKEVSWLNFLKFRGSWGLSGTLPQDFYAPFNVWDLPTIPYDGEGVATPSFTKPLTLPNLTWNKSEQTNIGFDLRMFNDRITLTVDGYRKITRDPIMSFPFQFYTGYTRLSYNVPMTIYNEGVDITLATRNMGKSNPFQWNSNLNLTFNKNRIGSLPFGNKAFYASSYDYNQQMLYKVGSPIYRWGQIMNQGVYNHQDAIPVDPITGKVLTYFKGNTVVKPGFPQWLDVNADGDVWDNSDRGAADGDLVPTGDPNPFLTGGFYNEFSYKNFTLGVLSTFVFGRDIINNLKSSQYNGIMGNAYKFANTRLPDLEGVDYWTPEKAQDPNYQAAFPSINPYQSYYYQFLPFSTMFNENGNFFKIKTITVGYNLPQEFINSFRLGLKNVRFYGMLDNIFTVQASTVPDAELVTPQGEYNGGAYPLPKKYTLGVEINF